MKLFALKQVDLWGDYGDMLISGFYRKDKPSSPALLHRSGPFLPPITFPWAASGEIVVVSERLKLELEASGISHVAFRKTIFEKVIRIDWHAWDRTAQRPKQRPVGGEPENYLMDQKHSEETAREMVPAWEALLEESPLVFAHWLSDAEGATVGTRDILLVDDSYCVGLFRSSFGGPAIVDDPTRAWLQARVPGWVSFCPLKVVTDPGAAQRLQSQRSRNMLAAPHLTPAEYRTRALALCQRKSYAVPPGLSRPDKTVSRYCVVLSDETPAKLSAASYDSFDALAAYVEHRRRLHAGGQDALSSILIYDLETGKRLGYLGNHEFTNVDDQS